jgi:tripartite-type tricarboxylate transporter receptor subunit TctC
MEANFRSRTARDRYGFIHRVICFCRDRAARRVMTTACALAALLLSGAPAAPLWAQTYPSKPVRFVLPFPAGGPTDILGRIMCQKLSDALGQPFIPENRPGSGGNIGAEVVAKARPDGYTLVLVSPSISISPSLYKKLNYDPAKDFAPISLVGQMPNVIIVRPSLPVKSLKELIEYAKANPGKLNYGSGGIGSTNQLTSELFKTFTNIDIVHVPYKGSIQAMTALLGGEVDMVTIGVPPSLVHIQSGKVRALAVLGPERLPVLPDVPTSREAGIDNFEVILWYGILAPAGTPRDIISRLNAEWVKIAAMPDTKEKMRKAEYEPMSSTPEQLADFIKAETVRWGKVIKDAKISID